MSWAKSDNRLFDKQMVKCDGCCEWFQRMCECIPEKPFNEKYVKWYCHKCLLLKKTLCLFMEICLISMACCIPLYFEKRKEHLYVYYSFVTPITVGNAPSKNCSDKRSRNFIKYYKISMTEFILATLQART